MPKRPPLQVANTSILLPLPEQRRGETLPTIRHSSVASYVGFANVETFLGNGITHDFTAEVCKEDLEDVNSFANDDRVKVEWGELAPLVTDRRREQFGEGRLVLARVGVEEFPSTVPFELRCSWLEILDQIDGEAAEAGYYADLLREKEDSFALLNGSLFLGRGLSVHPAVQGQQIGARLIAHSLGELHRGWGDVAFIHVYPFTNYFLPEEEPVREDAANLRRLVRYYERLGFQRAEPRGRITAPEPVPMYSRFGEFGLPVSGLGYMGIQEPAEGVMA